MSAGEGLARQAVESGYYLAVEEYFVSQRGDPLFLSNSDWLIVHEWKGDGVPLRVVLRGIADAFEGHRHSWSRQRKVKSLAYCRGEVDAACERWRRALAFGEEEGASRGERLRALAEALDAAAAPPDPVSRLALEIASELRASAGRPQPKGEAWLQHAEARLQAALVDELGPERVEAQRAEVARELSPYEARMPAKVLEQVRAEALTRRLFAERGLPRLSLLL
jgi:hypothetical protein